MPVCSNPELLRPWIRYADLWALLRQAMAVGPQAVHFTLLAQVYQI